MRGVLAALRMARREVRRSKGRSALVLALIGLPVFGATLAAVSYDMFSLTPPERLERRIGTAEAELRWDQAQPIIQHDVTGDWYEFVGPDQGREASRSPSEVEAVLPAGSRVIPRWWGTLRLPTAAGVGDLDWQAFDLTDPLTQGIAQVVQGRAPADAGEVAVTAAAARRLAATIGDTLTITGEGDRRVVGIVEFPGQPGSFDPQPAPGLDAQILLFHPDGRPSGHGPPRWLASTPAPIDWEQVRALNQHGIAVLSRAVFLDPPAELVTYADVRGPVSVPGLGVGLLIAGLVALEVVLLAGPAFAVGARRRQRELALVAAGGGTPAQLRRIVLADGVVLGALAAVGGTVLGIGLAFAARPLLEMHLVGARAGGYRVFPLALAGIAGFAVVTAVLAAMVPAFTAARQPVVEALAGRRGATHARRRWLVLGLVMVALGALVTAAGAQRSSETVVLAGLITGQVGLALCTPALVGLVARVGPRLRLAPRIALRDTARNRASAAPAIAAVMAAVAGAVTVGVVYTSLNARYGEPRVEFVPGTAVVDYWGGSGSPDLATIEQVARATLPVTGVYRLWSIDSPAGSEESPFPPYALMPPEAVCPYWNRTWDLTRAEQEDAAADPRCAEEVLQPFRHLLVADDTALPALTDAEPADRAAAAAVLRDGGAVVTDPRFLSGGRVMLGELAEDTTPRYDDVLTVPGHLLTTGRPRFSAIVSPEAVRAAGLEPWPGILLFTTERMPTQAEQDAFLAALTGLNAAGYVEPEPSSVTGDPMLLLLTAAAGLTALGAAAIATGLAAADRRGDLSTLAAIGAAPRVRRTLSLHQSGVVAGLGTVLGLLAGLGAALAVLAGMNQRQTAIWPVEPPIPITVPWLIPVVLLAVPVVAMLGAGLLTRSRLPIEHRRA